MGNCKRDNEKQVFAPKIAVKKTPPGAPLLTQLHSPDIRCALRVVNAGSLAALRNRLMGRVPRWRNSGTKEDVEAKSRKVKKAQARRTCVHVDQRHTPTRTRGTRFGAFEGHKVRREVNCPDEIRDTYDRTKVVMDTSKRTGDDTAIDVENVTRRPYEMKIRPCRAGALIRDSERSHTFSPDILW